MVTPAGGQPLTGDGARLRAHQFCAHPTVLAPGQLGGARVPQPFLQVRQLHPGVVLERDQLEGAARRAHAELELA